MSAPRYNPMQFNPHFSQVTIGQAVNAALGADRNKPETVYVFGPDGKRKFVQYVNSNPYTGA